MLLPLAVRGAQDKQGLLDRKAGDVSIDLPPQTLKTLIACAVAAKFKLARFKVREPLARTCTLRRDKAAEVVVQLGG
jgi:hypothetical protein